VSERTPLTPVDIEPPEDRRTRDIREDGIAKLRDFIEGLESGQLTEVMVIANTSDGYDTRVEWTGSRSLTSRLGCLEVLKHYMIAEAGEEE
jgi:hypothetical protein